MPHAQNIWQGLPQALKHQVIDDITAICTEVIHEHFRTHHPLTPQPQGGHLHSPVQPASNHHQPGGQRSSTPSSSGPLNAAGRPMPSRSSTPIWDGPPVPRWVDRDSSNLSPRSPSVRSESSFPTMSPGCHETAPTGIRCSTSAGIASVSLATATGSTTPLRSTGGSCSD